MSALLPSVAVASTDIPVNCTALINTRKYAPQCYVGEIADVHSLVGMNAQTHSVAALLSGRGQALAAASSPKQRNHLLWGGERRYGGITLYDLLVTGVGGSGTNLAASALRQHAGIVMGHESFLGKGSSSWIHAVNDAVVGLRYPFPRKGPNPTLHIYPENSPRFRVVVHQVRCPTANMAALTTHNNFSREFLWHAAGIDPTEPDPCLWGARVWLRWNRHVETYADHRIRVEDFVAPYSDLAGHLCSVAPGMRCRGSIAMSNTVRGARIGQIAARADKTTGRSSKTIGAPERTGWAQIAAALGFSGAIKGHHREHGTCSFDNMASKDPKLAGEVLHLAKHYGYSAPECDLGSAEAQRSGDRKLIESI